MVVEGPGGKSVCSSIWIAFSRERSHCIKRLVPWWRGHERGMIYHLAFESWQYRDHIAHSKAIWHHVIVEMIVKPDLCVHVATAFPRFPGIIACVAPGALLTRPLLTAKPLDLVCEGL